MRVDCVDSRPRRLPGFSGVAGGGSVAVVVVVVAVVVVAAMVFPWSGSASPESGAGAGVPDVCGLSTTVLLLLLSVGRGQEG